MLQTNSHEICTLNFNIGKEKMNDSQEIKQENSKISLISDKN